MLDRDGRREAAAAVRALARIRDGGQDGDPILVRSPSELRELAAALEAEPEGYDYEWAAAERGEALRALTAAVRAGQAEPGNRDNALRAMAALARAEEVMEGVQHTPALLSDLADLLGDAYGRVLVALGEQRTHVLVPRDVAEDAYIVAEANAGDLLTAGAGTADEALARAERVAQTMRAASDA